MFLVLFSVKLVSVFNTDNTLRDVGHCAFVVSKIDDSSMARAQHDGTKSWSEAPTGGSEKCHGVTIIIALWIKICTTIPV
jgi:hypothetical protein